MGMAQSSRVVQAGRAQRRPLQEKGCTWGRGRVQRLGRGERGRLAANTRAGLPERYMHVCRAHGLGAGSSRPAGWSVGGIGSQG